MKKTNNETSNQRNSQGNNDPRLELFLQSAFSSPSIKNLKDASKYISGLSKSNEDLIKRQKYITKTSPNKNNINLITQNPDKNQAISKQNQDILSDRYQKKNSPVNE